MKSLDAASPPTPFALKLFVTCLYIFMLCVGALLVQYSSLKTGKYSYDPAAVVFLVEMAKAVFSGAMVYLEYARTGYAVTTLCSITTRSIRVLAYPI